MTRADVALSAMEAVGGACLVGAVWAFYDGTRALAVFGLVLIGLAQFLDRRLYDGG
jgi:hypothetical protein